MKINYTYHKINFLKYLVFFDKIILCNTRYMTKNVSLYRILNTSYNCIKIQDKFVLKILTANPTNIL